MKYFASPLSVNTLIEAVSSVSLNDRKGVFFLVARQDAKMIPALIKGFNQAGLPLQGALFPALCYQGEIHTEGTFMLQLPVDQDPIFLKDLKNSSKEIYRESSDQPIPSKAFILTDGLSSYNSQLFKNLFHQFGTSCKFFGAGAGKDVQQHTEALFTNEGCFKNAAFVAFLTEDIPFQQAHDCEVLEDSLIASNTDGNRLLSLHWQNPLELLQQIIGNHFHRSLSPQEILRQSDEIFAGINCSPYDQTLRILLDINEQGHLIFAGEIPENSVLSILKSTSQDVVNSTRKAFEKLFEHLQDSQNKLFLITCFMRHLEKKIVQSAAPEFCKQLPAAIPHHKQLQGVLSLGEIASSTSGTIQFHNNSVIACRL